MKIKALLFAVLMALMLSGCTFMGTDIEGLLTPPKPVGEQIGIKDALQKAVGSSIVLKYPKSGEYQSAIVLYDLDSDGENEALAFYRLRSEGAGMYFNILKKDSGKWVSCAQYKSAYNDVETFTFCDLNGDGKMEILIGWSTHSSKNLSVYTFDENLISERFSDNYSEYQVHDFDADGKQEIIYIMLDNSTKSAWAKMIGLSCAGIEIQGEVKLNGNVSSYAKVQTGMIYEGLHGVFVDGYLKANRLITELVYFDGSELVAPFSDTETLPVTMRETAVMSMDIEMEGITEIPILSELPGYENSVLEEKKFLTSWYRYDGQKLNKVMSCILNQKENYYFKVLPKWEGKITAEIQIPSRTMIFYIYRKGQQGISAFGDPFMCIGVFTKQEWESEANDSLYTAIADKGDTVYAVALYSAAKELDIDIETVLQCFSLMP